MLWWRHEHGAVKFPKSWLRTLGYRPKIHHFFFSHKWDTRFKYLSTLCPYILMYSALHIMQWFSHSLDVFTPKIKRKFFDFYILWIKTNVAYTRLEMIAKQRSALQVQFITGVKLICYFVLYYCFLHWSHLPNMAVGDLAFYYTLYLCVGCHQQKTSDDINLKLYLKFYDKLLIKNPQECNLLNLAKNMQKCKIIVIDWIVKINSTISCRNISKF